MPAYFRPMFPGSCTEESGEIYSICLIFGKESSSPPECMEGHGTRGKGKEGQGKTGWDGMPEK